MYSKINRTGLIKKLLGVSIIVITSSSAVFASQLPTKSNLSITQGANAFSEPPPGSGSWFAMEALGPGGWLYIGIGGNEGLQLGGAAQFSRAAGVAPELTEVSSVDNNWIFFGATGLHGHTGITISDNATAGTADLDFTAWYVSWNNVANISMGGDPGNFPSNTGIATITCGLDCAVGDTYSLDYDANVPLASSDFPGVAYRLHLEGTITDTNLAPTATTDPLLKAVAPNGTITVDITGNVTDPDGDGVNFSTTAFSYSGSRAPDITNNFDGTFTYTDTAGTETLGTPDTFSYTVEDNLGKVSDPFDVDVTVTTIIPPQTQSFSVATDKNQSIDVDVVAQTTTGDNPIDPGSVVVTVENDGTTSVNGSIVTFTPALNFTGPASFTFTVDDDDVPANTSLPATVTVNVNAPPIAVDDAATVDRNTTVDIDVTDNDTDSDGTVDPATVNITSPATSGLTSINAGVVTYTPDTDFLGNDSFEYTVKDNAGLISETTATVNISVINAIPVATNATAGLEVSTSVDIDLTGNVADSDGTVDFTTFSTTYSGTATITDNDDGTVTYQDNGGVVVTDTFDYTFQDNNGGVSNEATVVVTVKDSGGAVLPVDATLTILPANVGSGTITPADGAGSWFNMEVSPGALTHVSIQGLNQLQLGTTQLGKITEPNIDNPWQFFGNLGIHQTTSDVLVLSDDGQGNVTLDLSGWNVAWNNVASIPLNARAHLPGFVDGVGIMTCANDCAVGDSYKLEYSARVPDGDPSSFGNVKYILHLEGVVSQGVPTYGGGDENAAFVVTESIAKDGNGEITVAPGSTAESAGNTTGTGLAPSDIGLKDPLLNDSDGEQCIGGCVDFILTEVTTSFVDLVFKLNDTIPNGAVYRKLMNGVWGDFDESSGDQIASAKSIGGACQGPEGVFEIGLRLGSDCLFMRIFDNGPNDADGTVGTIVDPSGILFAGSSNRPAGSTDGCSISPTPVALRDRADWILIAIFLSIMGLVKVRRKYNA